MTKKKLTCGGGRVTAHQTVESWVAWPWHIGQSLCSTVVSKGTVKAVCLPLGQLNIAICSGRAWRWQCGLCLAVVTNRTRSTDATGCGCRGLADIHTWERDQVWWSSVIFSCLNVDKRATKPGFTTFARSLFIALGILLYVKQSLDPNITPTALFCCQCAFSSLLKMCSSYTYPHHTWCCTIICTNKTVINSL